MHDDRAALAARENADWCDLFCRHQGVIGTYTATHWSSSRRTPDFYPDAVALDPNVRARDVLAGIDTSAGASVKDSFASMELNSCGFRTLFDATWLWREPQRRVPGPIARGGWREVAGPSELTAWEQAWAGEDPRPGFFPESVLSDPDVRLLGEYDGPGVVAGMVLHHGRNVLGISNVFDRTGDLERTWALCLREALRVAPRLPFVGYEQGEDLAIATRLGFEAVGPLRVWIRDESDAGPTHS